MLIVTQTLLTSHSLTLRHGDISTRVTKIDNFYNPSLKRKDYGQYGSLVLPNQPTKGLTGITEERMIWSNNSQKISHREVFFAIGLFGADVLGGCKLVVSFMTLKTGGSV